MQTCCAWAVFHYEAAPVGAFLLTTGEEHESVMNTRKKTVRRFYKEMAVIISESLL